MKIKKITNAELAKRSILLLDYYPEIEKGYDPFQFRGFTFEICFSEDKFIKLKQEELELQLINVFKASNFCKQNTLLVFVGQSSLELKHRMENLSPGLFLGYQTKYVHAQRVYENITLKGRKTYFVKATVDQIDCPLLQANQYRQIVVIDDVISSGITLKTLRGRNLPQFSGALWMAMVLLSKQEKLKGYQSIIAPVFVENPLAPVSTFSKLVEDEKIREEYLLKHFGFSAEQKEWANIFFNSLNSFCIHTPHVFCFDLYNTLVKETNECLVEGNVDITIPSYLDYFVERYGQKYSLTKEIIYPYIRDCLMNMKYDNFEAMTKLLYSKFIPNEPCTTRKVNSIANLVEWFWRVGSSSAEWINESIPGKLDRLKVLGHKVVLITNCTFPAWQKVKQKLEIEKHFDACFVSSVEGVSKPNVAVWEKVESWLPEFQRNKFVMVGDDTADDLITPKKRGWKTIPADMLCFEPDKKIFYL